MMLLFDSDVLIDLLRGKEKTGLQVEKLLDEGDEMACSVITVAEIHAGMKKGEEKSTGLLLNDLMKENVTEEIAQWGGILKGSTKSHQLCLDDCLIAATALVKGAILVTKNVKHYPFKNLKVEKIH